MTLASSNHHGIFPLPDSDSDSFLDGYIVLCRSFSTGLDLDSDPYSDGFLNGYCTHFRDRSPSQFYYISIRGSESESKPVEKPAYYRNSSPNLTPAVETRMHSSWNAVLRGVPAWRVYLPRYSHREQNSWHTLLKILPFPKLNLLAVISH